MFIRALASLYVLLMCLIIVCAPHWPAGAATLFAILCVSVTAAALRAVARWADKVEK